LVLVFRIDSSRRGTAVDSGGKGFNEFLKGGRKKFGFCKILGNNLDRMYKNHR
jgi:hypothetical protein